MIQLQNTFEVANRDYAAINDMLKQELPLYIHLRLRIVIPILHALVQHNLNLFQSYNDQYVPLTQFVGNLNEPVVDAVYLERRKIADELIDQISILKMPVRRPSNASSNGGGGGANDAGGGGVDAQEFDDETPPPYYSTASTTSSSRGSLSAKPPLVTPKSNPFTGSAPASSSQSSLNAPPKPASIGSSLNSVSSSSYKPVPSPFAPAAASSSSAGAGGMAAAAAAYKKPAPAPVPAKPAHLRKSLIEVQPTATALYDFVAQEPGDLGFTHGQKISIVEKTSDANGWWRGRLMNHLNQPVGDEGIFPGNYVQLD